jgi:hypothetical protein
MRARPGRTLSLLVIVAIGMTLALGLVLAVAPETQPVILLGGAVACVVLYGIIYVVERRRHW